MIQDSRTMFKAILLGGLIAGTLDIGAACLTNFVGVTVILHAIASGLLGQESAFSGGLSTALLGLVLQWGMSILIAAIFVTVVRRFPLLKRRWIETRLGYGVVIFFVMNYAVLPLSAVGIIPHFTPISFAANMLAMLIFGFIVSFFSRPDLFPRSRLAAQR